MIRIGNPYCTRTDTGRSRLNADLMVDGPNQQNTTLWMEVDTAYEKYLCNERADAFVVGLLNYAMEYGHDIVSEAPVTERLYSQLIKVFLPAYCRINSPSANRISPRLVKVTCPTAPEVEHPEDGLAIGTGVSCGVDSMHVLATHPELTHGCVWNFHVFHYKSSDADRERKWTQLQRQAKTICDAAGIKLLVGDSNFDGRCLPGLMCGYSTTYANLFMIFALQKLWKRFYIASEFDITEFKLDYGLRTDCAYYDHMLLPYASIGRMSVLTDDMSHNRLEKVKDIIEYKPAHDLLNVCWNVTEGRNCSHNCLKCQYTMMEIDYWGGLDHFSSVFDVEYFRKHFEVYLAAYYREVKNQDTLMLELGEYIARRKIPFKTRIQARYINLRQWLVGFDSIHRFGFWVKNLLRFGN